MANAVPNHFKYLLATKQVDFANDAFIVILMQSGFVFDIDAHAEYADVSGNELPAGNGYLQFTKALAGVAVVEDDVDDRCEITWNNATWAAVGGAIGPASGAIILDNTLVNDPVAGYIDFYGDYTQPDGGTATLIGPEIRIS